MRPLLIGAMLLVSGVASAKGVHFPWQHRASIPPQLISDRQAIREVESAALRHYPGARVRVVLTGTLYDTKKQSILSFPKYEGGVQDRTRPIARDFRVSVRTAAGTVEKRGYVRIRSQLPPQDQGNRVVVLPTTKAEWDYDAEWEEVSGRK